MLFQFTLLDIYIASKALTNSLLSHPYGLSLERRCWDEEIYCNHPLQGGANHTSPPAAWQVMLTSLKAPWLLLPGYLTDPAWLHSKYHCCELEEPLPAENIVLIAGL